MARYDYRCPGCGDVLEVTHDMADDPDIACDECGTARVRLIGTPMVMPSATPTRGEGARVGRTNQEEVTLSEDMAAYKRARLNGDQPEGLTGQAEREKRAETQDQYLGTVA